AKYASFRANIPLLLDRHAGEESTQDGKIRAPAASVLDDRGFDCLKVARIFMELSPDQKLAGVLAPLFALRGQNDLGVGDVGALREFIDWSAEQGFRVVQLLPVNETGNDNSPYNAISSVALEPTTI